MPETCRIIYSNKYVFASSGYLSSVSYMMQDTHTSNKYGAGKQRRSPHQASILYTSCEERRLVPPK